MRLYTALSEVQAELLKHAKIDLVGIIDDDMANYVREALVRLGTKGSPDILVTITSTGGNYVQGMYIYDMLKMYSGKKIGLVVQYAESMAGIILQACEERQCLPHSYLRIHSLRLTNDNLVKLERDIAFAKLKKLFREGVKGQKQLEKLLSKRTGQSRKKIKKLVHEDRRINSQEALRLNIVDKIV